MAIRPEFRWWILTLVVVGGLLGISALALNRPNVEWLDASPYCPFCRSVVEFYGQRCPTCGERYDWTIAPPEESPISHYTLSPLEAQCFHDWVKALGPDRAADRVAAKLHLSKEAARAYLDRVGSGQCGWCGGTKRDLSAGPDDEEKPCPVCFGDGRCISCGRGRRVLVGDEGAHRAWLEWRAATRDLSSWVPWEVRLEEVARLTQKFLASHAGTEEAQRIGFWPQTGWRGLVDGARPYPTAVSAAHARLTKVFAALSRDE